jgi:hypothetical protein
MLLPNAWLKYTDRLLAVICKENIVWRGFWMVQGAPRFFFVFIPFKPALEMLDYDSKSYLKHEIVIYLVQQIRR